MPIIRDLIIKYVLPRYRIITFAGFFAGLIPLSIFTGFDRRIEMEEHGMMPTSVKSEFKADWKSRLKSNILELERYDTVGGALNATFAKIPGQPLFEVPYKTSSAQGSNYYTVVESERGDSRESLVLVISTQSFSLGPKSSSWGLGVGLTLAHYFRQVKWMSRDVLIVFIDGSVPYAQNIRTFLHQYTSGTVAIPRRGLLRQALVLDMHNEYDAVHLDIDGINGMLPNQDLVNHMIYEARNKGVKLREPRPWLDVRHRFFNGGVHKAHSVFLEYQVPAFTVTAERKRAKKQNPDYDKATKILQIIEGTLHGMSNILQQLHHSFNAYFYNTLYSHLSTGIYLYPLYFMQAPLLTYLSLSPPFIGDIRSILAGMFSVLCVQIICGGVPFLLATNEVIAKTHGLSIPTCDGRGEMPATTAQIWLLCAAISIILFGLILRTVAWHIWDESGKKQHFTIPYPLWNTIKCSNGLVFFMMLAPLTIYNWAMAVPLTVIMVPTLLLVTPFSTESAFTSIMCAAVLAAHLLPFMDWPLDTQMWAQNYFSDLELQFKQSIKASGIRPEMYRYVPTPLISFLCGKLGIVSILAAEPFLQLYKLAEEYVCVGGSLFPIICFIYIPYIAVIFIIGICLPIQKMEKSKVTLQTVLLYVVSVIVLVAVTFLLGIVWKTRSSSGQGEFKIW